MGDTRIMSPDLPFGRLPPDQIVPALPKAVWFSAVGKPLDNSEREECAVYLRGLGLQGRRIETVRDWLQAAGISNAPGRSQACRDQERAEERRLFEIAASKYSADAVLMRLANLMEGSAELFHAPATVACTRAGSADPELAGAAASAATQSLHQYGLAAMAGEGDGHSFAAKFRLFLTGRWPLCVDENFFYIF